MNALTFQTWDLGVYIIGTLLLVFIAAAVVLLPIGLRKRKVEYDRVRQVEHTTYPSLYAKESAYMPWLAPGVIATVLAGLFLFISLLGAFPYQTKYLSWYSTTATVETVSNVVSDASGEFTSTPVVTLSTLDEPVTVSNERIVTMIGDEATFRCKPTWHHLAPDTWHCVIQDY